MLLKQVFKSLAGAQRRAAFENAHSANYRFLVTRCIGGVPDEKDFDFQQKYDYRIEKKSKRRG